MRTEPVLILAGFAATLATAVNGLILAFWKDLNDVQAGAVCSAVTVVFALGAALIARGRVYSPQTVEGVGPSVARMAAAAASSEQSSEHARLAALEPKPAGQVLMDDGSWVEARKPAKAPPAMKASARRR